MFNENRKITSLLLVVSLSSLISTEPLFISEQSNFFPCSLSNGKLVCDAKTLTNNTSLSFQTPSTTKIERLEVLNLPLEEIPANYISAYADSLLSIKIYSSLPIIAINRVAFSKCSKVQSLEIKSMLPIDDKFIDLNNMFLDLVSLEHLKLNGFKISELNLNYLQTLKSISIENSYLNSISTDTFEKNLQLSVLNIVGIKKSTNLFDQFTNWPSKINTPITNLNLENNNLNFFPNFSSSFAKNLVSLSLKKNPIEKIETQDTENLKELSTLLLSATNLNHQFMSGLKMLKKLKLINLNDIQTMKDLPTEIEEMQSLESLYVDMNQFEELSVTLPSSIKTISASYLRKNVKFSLKFLSKCDKLELLNLNALDTSDINFLVNKAYVFQNSLTSLSLDENFLLAKDLWTLIKSLTKLETLYLGKLNIDSIPNDVLFNLVNLKKLFLYNNNLRYDSINTEGFQRVAQHLTDLDLRNNQLINLPPCLFYMLPSLNQINLLETGIDCDCNLRWLYEKIITLPTVLPKLNFTCASGKNAKRSLYNLTRNDLSTCSSAIETCTPIKTGNYKIEFSVKYEISQSKLNIVNINASHLKFLFDFLKVNVKQENRTLHSDFEKYSLNRTSILVNHEMQFELSTVCLLLIRNNHEYDLSYNCQSVFGSKITAQASWGIWFGVCLASLILIAIICTVVIILLRRKSVKKTNSEEKYSNCSTEYSEPNDTYQSPDQYTEISSNDEYTYAERNSMVDMSYQFNRSMQNFTETDKSLRRMTMPSKSVDEGLDLTQNLTFKSRFQKSRHKPLRIIAKRQRDCTSLHNISITDPSLPRKYNPSSRASLPRQYISRDLPVPPEGIPMQNISSNVAPPKPKFPSTDIRNLLNNADNHLKYFSNDVSSNSLCTDESANHPHSGDSGLGVSKLSNNLQIRLSEDNSVII